MVDHLTREQRARAMSNVQRENGGLESLVQGLLRKWKLWFQSHVRGLPGTPDIVFPKAKVAVFIDGDYWHGYRLALWEHKLSPFWRDKIRANRRRDQSNFRRLRYRGWQVVRVWQHEITKDLDRSIDKIRDALDAGS